MDHKLRHHNIARETKGSQSFESKEWIHKILAISLAKAINSAFVEEWATVCCFPDF